MPATALWTHMGGQGYREDVQEQLRRGLHLLATPGASPLRAASLLAPLAGVLEGPEATRLRLARAELYLHLGAREASLQIEEDQPGPETFDPTLAEERVRLALSRHEFERAERLVRGLPPASLAHLRLAAARGDPQALDRCLERLPPDPSVLLPEPGTPRDRMLLLAAAEARGALHRVLPLLEEPPSLPGWDLDRCRRRAAGTSPSPGGTPYVHWPGVSGLAAAGACALAALGDPVDPWQLESEIHFGFGDVPSPFRLAQWLERLGHPSTHFPASPDGLRRLLAAELTAILHLELPDLPSRWAVLVDHDPEDDAVLLHFPDQGVRRWLDPATLAEAQAAYGASTLALGRREDPTTLHELRLETSLDLELLDRALVTSQEEGPEAARLQLRRSENLCQQLRPFWQTLQEIEAGRPELSPEQVEERLEELAGLEKRWPEDGWPLALSAALLRSQGRGEEVPPRLEIRTPDPPRGPLFWYELGLARNERGDHERALEALYRAGSRAPLDPWILEEACRGLSLSGHHPEAAELSCVLIRRFPERAYAWYLRAMVLLLGAGPMAETEAAFRRSLELDPVREGPYLNLSDLLLRQDRTEEALALLEQGLHHLPGSEQIALNLASSLFDVGRFEETCEAAAHTLSRGPGDRSHPMGLALTGGARCRLGQDELGIPLLERALALRPAYAWAIRELAIHLHGLERSEEALETLERGAAACPEDAFLRVVRGRILQDQGRFPEAVRSLEQARSLGLTEDPEVLERLDSLYREQGEPDRAQALWEELLATSENPGPLRKSYLAELLARNQYEEAQRHGQRAAVELPEDPKVAAWLAFALLRGGSHREALPWVRRALELDPEAVFARSLMLDVLTELPDHQAAVDFARAQPGPWTSTGHHCLRYALTELQRFEEALEALEEARRAHPEEEAWWRNEAARILAFQVGDLTRAREASDQALALAPEDLGILELRASILIASRDYEAADLCLDRMVYAGAELPRLVRTLYRLADQRGDRAGRSAAAIQLAGLQEPASTAWRHWRLRAALADLQRDASPESLEASLADLTLTPREAAHLAYELAQEGYLEAARTKLALVGEEAPDTVLRARGFVHEWEERPDPARDLAEELSSRFPEDHRGPELRALVLLVRGQDREALEAAAAAVARGRDHGWLCSDAQTLLGTAAFFCDQRDRAREAFERARALAKDDSPGCAAHFMLAWFEGRTGAAREALERLLSAPSSSPWNKKLARRLGEATGLLQEA